MTTGQWHTLQVSATCVSCSKSSQQRMSKLIHRPCSHKVNGTVVTICYHNLELQYFERFYVAGKCLPGLHQSSLGTCSAEDEVTVCNTALRVLLVDLLESTVFRKQAYSVIQSSSTHIWNVFFCLLFSSISHSKTDQCIHHCSSHEVLQIIRRGMSGGRQYRDDARVFSRGDGHSLPVGTLRNYLVKQSLFAL